jgi:ATP/maltotriose-dependent transcriptional regulator MalT
MLTLLRSDNTIRESDLRSLISAEDEVSFHLRRGGDYVSFMQDVPLPRRFFGRERELDEIREWLEDERSSMFAVTGIAGIGKTTLSAKAAKTMEEKTHIFWYRFHKWDSLRNVLYSMSRFLEEMGRPSFKKYMDTAGEVEKKDFYPILQKSLKSGPILMVFDDFQRAVDEIVEFFSDLKEMLASTQRVKIMVVGRQVVPFYDRSDVLVKKLVRELNLGGLDRESSKGLLRVEDMTDEVFDKIYQVTMGHPLFLQLVLSATDLEDQKDIKRYIYEEIFKKLEEKESILLQIASRSVIGILHGRGTGLQRP